MLLVLNGAPAVGKSTLARRYADDHPLTLVTDIDLLRTQLGRWEERSDSRVVARDLAVAMLGAHLRDAHDVVVPQYIGRPEFLERLRAAAADADAPFVEVVLTGDIDEIIGRFRARRVAHAVAGTRHPEADLDDDAIETELPIVSEQLLRDAVERSVPIISVDDGPEAAYRALCELLPGPEATER